VKITSPRLDPYAVSPGSGRTRPTIELHISEVAQLFDSFDPCPFYDRDLDSDAEEYIVASVRELRHPADAVIFHVDELGGGAQPDMVEPAIHSHFARKAALTSHELNALLRRGWISLFIGIAFLIALLTLSEVITLRLSEGAFATALRESLVIGGWVAMWRPLEIFLYDWWPIAGQRRIYAFLSSVPVKVQRSLAKPG
jgi:hypothetical protein